jgi:hypothetical protein
MFRRLGLTAAVVAVVLATGARPASADPGGPGGGDGACPTGPGGVTGIDLEYRGSTSTNVGLTLPVLNVAPIATNAVISPGPGETFDPITLVAVRATPTAKVLRNETVDPDHAVMEWVFTVEQRCWPSTELATCAYVYHEMADGKVAEVDVVDGQPIERAFLIECQNVRGFRAVGAPADLGVRLLAAAKANVPPEQIQANATAALGANILAAGGLPNVPLPADIAAWSGTFAVLLGAVGVITGACWANFVAVVGAEIVVWVNLLTIPGAPPIIQAAKATAAVAAKFISAVSWGNTMTSCMAVSYASSGALVALCDLMMSFATIVFWSSTLTLVGLGIEYAVEHWL